MKRFQGELRAIEATGYGQTERVQGLRKQWESASKAHDAALGAVERILQHDPEADLAAFVQRAKEHRERRDKLARQIAEVESDRGSSVTDSLLVLDANAFAAHVCGMLSRLPEVIESSVLSTAEKRFILDAAIDQIVPVNETPEKQRYRRWGIEIELRPDLLASAVGRGIDTQGAEVLPRPTC